jgi:iron complex outermembrane receptor protein
MATFSLKSQLAVSVSALMIAASFSTASFAQSNDASVQADEIITTGTRRKARSAADAPAPVDVISAAEFTNQGTSDIGELLRTVVPSYNVNSQPISDAASIIRPANLRGLSPDNTLVLLNGKRRHRGSVIAFLGGGISDGAQGVDISVFPSIGLKQVEVLRDGASSQYGSDAIAGVINFVLDDAREGGMIEVKYGSTYDGDGDNYRISGNIGLPLGENGFVNISGEYGESDGTIRSVQRTDAAALIAAGNTAVSDISVNTQTADFAQYWGRPDVTDEYKVFINSGIELSETAELYAFGNYAERTVEGGFFFRNPTNRGGVFAGPTVDPLTGAADPNGVASVRVATLPGGDATSCPRGIPLTGTNGLIPDAGIAAAVAANPLCFAFTELFPGGFTPRFGGNNRDYAITGGLRGELDFGTGLGYDISGSYGSSKTDFFINNTINASLGPDTPTSFVPGAYEQIETAFNLDLTYGLPVANWASDLNIAAGFEWRDEQFDITAGDPASFALGPLSSPTGVTGFPNGQGFSSSSNGFGGFSTSTSNSQGNIAIYGELEADITDQLTLQAALRWEDYDLFGTTTNFKVGGLYKISDGLRVRGTFSTGFHAPTAGQANVTNVTTQFVNGVLQDQGTVPLTSNPGQLAADFLEATRGTRPELGPEEATNISLGIGFDLGPSTWTVDYFNIKVSDRVALTDNLNFLQVLDFVAARDNVANYDNSNIGAALTSLGNAGSLDRNAFVGFEDLSSFRFFSNSFGTKTQGIDIVGNLPFDIGVGSTSAALALNYTDTTVTDIGSIAPLGANRIIALQDALPNWKGNLSFNHQQGNWRALARVNYHSGWRDSGQSSVLNVGGEFTVDLEVGVEVIEGFELSVGASNLFDGFPDENPFQGGSGQLYPESSPFGFDGGSYYIRGRYTFGK